jgi:4-amino-4-deoxy-L-arabinose transferase-like glycosyltransferase
MKKWVLISLAAVFFLAILMRLYPLTQFAIWGSDSGEYYSIIGQLTKDGYIKTDYNGWGFAYPYFPGMFHLSGSISHLLGISNLSAMILFIPFTASFSVLLVFFLAKMIFKSNEAGILGGAFLAVAMPHVFTTSHPMPGSLGDLFLILALLLFFGSLKNKKFLPLLILASFALIVTHHLSSYFFFIMGLGGLFVLELLKNEDSKRANYLWGFLFFFLTILILFWSMAAQPFYESVVSDAFALPVWVILSLGYVLLIAAFFIVRIRRQGKWNYEPRFPKPRIQVLKYLALLFVLFLILTLVTLNAVPGTNIDLKPTTILLFAPFLALAAFGSVGPGYVRFFKNGIMVYGWILALFLSLLIGVITSNRVLLPYRHPEYLMIPLVLFFGIGIVMVFNVLGGKKIGVRALLLTVIITLLILSTASAYPGKDIMGGFQEGTSQEDLQGVIWAGESLEADSTVASDHRMSSMIFGFSNLNATWDSAEQTLHGEKYSDFSDELEEIDIPSGKKPINYVLLDDDIKEGAALLQWENARPLSQNAQDKFQRWPFVKLYEANGVEIYGIVR